MIPICRAAAVLLASSALVHAQWTLKSPVTSPSARQGAGATWEATSGQVLLFGGGLSAPPFLSNETWRYDGFNWTQLAPATSPTGRFGAQLVHDFARNVSVLYGGLATAISIPPPNSDTWEFDGTTWTQVTPVGNPGPRYWYGACYDIGRLRTVIYGGSSSQLGFLNNQTWEYDGTTWSQITTTGNPGGLDRPAMCFHPVFNRVVLFGGSNGSSLSDQTWLYDGNTATWTQVPITGAKPSPRNAASMVYDATRNLCVLSGGQDTSGALSDTWTLGATGWQQQPNMGESVRDLSTVWLPSIGKTVKFGGRGGPASAQTWEFGSGVLGTGCPGTNGVPTLSQSSAPLIGQPYTLTASNLNPTFSAAALVFGFTQLPGIDLGPIIDMPGCLAFTTLDATEGIGGSGGIASWTWNSVFGNVGDSWYTQAAGFDPGVNGFGFTISNAVFVTIGS